MIYIFTIMVILITVFFITEIVEVMKGRKWGENP